MSITEFVQSPVYKKVMAYVYGFGAAVAIMGALFKILHLPGASFMLMAGLGVEALIFALSSFEPPHEMPDWSLVYPELIGLEPEESHSRNSGMSVGNGGGSELSALVSAGSLEQKTVDELTQGIKKLATTTSQMSDLADATVVTKAYINNMKGASDSVQKLSAVQAGAFDAISENGSKLAESYNKLEKSVSAQAETLKNSGSKVADQLSSVGNNLTAINSAYELQLNGISKQIESSKALTSDMNTISEHMKASVDGVKEYRTQIAQLSKTVGELNSIYGNMLSAVTNR